MRTGVRASAVIVKDGKILLIRRFRKKQGEYWVFPGGGVEEGDTPEETVVREVKEETGLDVSCKEKIYETVVSVFPQPYFLCKLAGGEELKLGGPEAERQSEDDKYEPQWVELSKIKDLLLYPLEVRDFVYSNFITL